MARSPQSSGRGQKRPPTPPPEGESAGPVSRPGTGVERQRAYEAGRAFHQFRVRYCAAVLGPFAGDIEFLTATLLPHLTRSVAGMGPDAADGRDRPLERKLADRLRALGSDEHADWLESEAEFRNALEGAAREGFDSHAHRTRHLANDHATFDGLARDTLHGLPGPIVAAFRLGEVVARGVYPDGPPVGCPVDEVPPDGAGDPGPDPPPPGPAGWPTDPRVQRPLDLADPRTPGDRPWEPGWVARVTDAWAAAWLPPGPLVEVLSDRTPCATGPDRVSAVERVDEAAAAQLGRGFHAAVTVADRFRVVDEGAMQVSLDGHTVTISSRPAFAVVQALLAAPGHWADTCELRSRPGLKRDLSKVVKLLPEEIRAVIRGTPGAGSYQIVLPPRDGPT